jgi:hypothetical protein
MVGARPPVALRQRPLLALFEFLVLPRTDTLLPSCLEARLARVVQSRTGKVDKFDDPPITDPETMPNSRSHPGEFMGGI